MAFSAARFSRWLLLGLAALCILLLALAPPAQAVVVQQERLPVEGEFFDSCTGEVFTFEGIAHFVISEEVDKAGGEHFTLHSSFQGKGESADGTKYVITDKGNLIRNLGAGEPDSADTFTLTDPINVIRQGEADTEDDLIGKVVFHITFDANGNLRADVGHVEFECK